MEDVVCLERTKCIIWSYNCLMACDMCLENIHGCAVGVCKNVVEESYQGQEKIDAKRLLL
ncbi:hypothetical protein DXB23_10065 [Dorea sp. OM02-2LB]|nr:hypothetical protein DXB23_10065 [Dorea sp. OM02-2LB]